MTAVVRVVAEVACRFDERVEDPSVAPVVFVHGGGGSGRQWAPVVEGLRPDLGAVVVDLPGHGTGTGTVSRTVAEAADRVAAAVAAVVPGDAATIVGHSLGGLVALQLALAQPDLVSHLVLVATAAQLRLHPLLLAQVTCGRPDPAFFRGSFGPTMPAGSAEFVFDDIRHVRPRGPGEYFDTEDVDLGDRLGEIDAPAAVLIARGDRVVSPRRSRALATGLRSATAHVLAGGHYLQLERPMQVQDLIADLVPAITAVPTNARE